MKTLISIITVTLNCKSDLIKTINSVQNQTYKNFNHIIKDGNSVDGLELIDFSKFKNTIFYQRKDQGIYDAMNQGLELATGDLFMFLNAGDILYSNYIFDKIAILAQKNKSFFCISGKTLQVTKNYKSPIRLLGKNRINKFFPLAQYPHPSFILNKKIVDNIKPLFDSNLTFSADYKQQLLIRKKKLWKVYFMDEIITIMPMGGKSTSSKLSFFKGFLEVLIFSFEMYGLFSIYIVFIKFIFYLINKNTIAIKDYQKAIDALNKKS